MALKTAMLATGRRGVIAFENSYHGLGYGALDVTHREHFRQPFHSQLGDFTQFVPFPTTTRQLEAVEKEIRGLLQRGQTGAVLVDPVQGRGGINVPPKAFLPHLRKLCDEHGTLLILDEIYTGFGRTGKWFACEHSRTVPDLICLGKALTGGFPMSACVGRADLMDAAWPASTGEAIHTSTFLGHPVGCAMALAQIREIERHQLVEQSAELGALLLSALRDELAHARLKISTRGLGLLAGVELRLPDGAPATTACLRLVKDLLHAGFILLPEGPHGNVLSFSPSLTITRAQIFSVIAAAQTCLTGSPETP